MNVEAFRADKGDCLLLTGDSGEHVLIDGGMRHSYRDHVAPALAGLAEAGVELDLVCVSHIDQDHIAGVLRMMDDTLDWRVFDFQRGQGNNHFPQPDSPRPPQVRALWHNTFSDLTGENSGPIEQQLVANLRLLHLNEQILPEAIARHAGSTTDLVNSIREGILLSKRVGSDQLGIPVNEPTNGGVMLAPAATAPPLQVGNLSFFVLGPFPEDLTSLRQEWNDWLEANLDALETIRRQAEDDAENLPMDEGQLVLSSLLSLANELGDRGMVTTPNLASLMFLAEGEGHSLLLTGDGHADDVLRGLQAQGKLDDQGRIHVDVLKVQHHGSEHNVHADFCRRVTADHYLFCANGAHENPDLRVVELILETRLGPNAAGPDRAFWFWFTSSAQLETSEARRHHMEQVRRLVDHAARRSGTPRRLRYRFLTRGSSLSIEL
ncbi:MAG TPA: MBL fold metallo-hydrolase [Anaerolineales bacterium]